MTRNPASLQERALRWLAQREHSRSELRAKLLRAARQAVPADPAGDEDAGAAREAEVDALLDRLQVKGLLSEQRFVDSRVRTRAAGRGTRRIEAELAQHGVRLDDAARRELLAGDLPRAVALWRKRFGAPPADARERERQMRFLHGRGFDAEVIRQVLRRASAADDAGDG